MEHNRSCSYTEISNNLGNWTLPLDFIPSSMGGKKKNVEGVIGHTAVGEVHSAHIVKTMLFASTLKGFEPGKRNKEQLFVDAGAHIGTITIPLMQAFENVGEHAKCYSIEILPEIHHCLLENVKNNTTNSSVCVTNCALTSPEIFNEKKFVKIPALNDMLEKTAGCSTYFDDDSDSKDACYIETATIDDILIDEKTQVTAIKVDCEGSDLDVLKGAVTVIGNSRPVILFEDHDRTHTNFEIKHENSGAERIELHIRDMLHPDFQAFFADLEYSVYVNWMYTSWSEFVAIPNELLDRAKTMIPAIALCSPGDFYSSNWTYPPGGSQSLESTVAGVVGSIVSAWSDEIESSWYEKKRIDTVEDVVMYIKEIVKC